MESKRFVPWFSMDEWKHARALLYSTEVSDLEKGHKLLQVWKARYPVLPVGVECTLEIVKVMIQDQITASEKAAGRVPSHVDSSKLVYSSVIMRFLNFVTELKSAEVSTIYRAASELNIPDWIVNMRHDAAHGRNIPPMHLLRSAIKLIFKWLYENYWADEPESSLGYSVPEEGEMEWEKKLANLIDYYISISRFCLTGVTTLDQLNSFPEGKILYQKLNEDKLLQSFQLSGTDFVLLTDVRQKILRKLQHNIGQRSSKCQNDEALVKILTLETKNMLIGETSAKGSVLSRDWFEMWWQVLKHLSGSTIHKLLLALKDLSTAEEKNHRMKMAALWLFEFFRVIKNSTKSTDGSEKETLNPNQIPDKEKLQTLIKETCLHPSQTTPVYLPRLLDLSEPKLDRKTKNMIVELHNIYSGRKIQNEVGDEVVHSLENLLIGESSGNMNSTVGIDAERVEDEEEMEISSNSLHPGPFGIWNRAQGDSGWNACPIGVVPWQRQRTLPNWYAVASI